MAAKNAAIPITGTKKITSAARLTSSVTPAKRTAYSIAVPSGMARPGGIVREVGPLHDRGGVVEEESRHQDRDRRHQIGEHDDRPKPAR